MNKWQETVLNTPTLKRKQVAERNATYKHRHKVPVVIGSAYNVDRLLIVDSKGRKEYEPVAYQRQASPETRKMLNSTHLPGVSKKKVAAYFVGAIFLATFMYLTYGAYSDARMASLTYSFRKNN